MSLNYVFARHGEADSNLAIAAGWKGDDRLLLELQRQLDRAPDNYDLTPLGVAQARELRARIEPLIEEVRNGSPVYYYHSPLIRAHRTARLALPNVPESEWRSNRLLAERLWDCIRGYDPQKPLEEYFTRCIERATTIDECPAPGGESARQKYADVVAFFDHVRREHESGTVVITNHGEWMLLARLHLLGLGIDAWPTISREPVLNCQIEAYVCFDPNNRTSPRGNTVSHRKIIFPPNDHGLVPTDWIPINL